MEPNKADKMRRKEEETRRKNEELDEGVGVAG